MADLTTLNHQPPSFSPQRTTKTNMARINELPNELLVQVFTELRDFYVQNGEGVERMRWLRLTKVCRRWNAVATTTPALWTTLDFYADATANIVDAFLSRSGELSGLVVSLDFGMSAYPPSWSGAIHGSPHTGRFSQLTIRWHQVQNSEVYRFIEGLRATSITALTLVENSCSLRPEEPIPEDRSIAAPSLMHLPGVFADESMTSWSSETDEASLAEEESVDDHEPKGYLGGSGYEDQLVPGVVFRDRSGSSSSEGDSQDEEEDLKYAPGWDAYDTDWEYDGSEEGVSEDEDVSEEGSEGEVVSEDEDTDEDSHRSISDTDTDLEAESEVDDDEEEPSSGDEQSLVGVFQAQGGLADATTDEEEDPTVLSLPHFPALASLSMSGLLFVKINPHTKRALTSLAVLDTAKFMSFNTPTDDRILDILEGCTSLEELTLYAVCLPECTPDDGLVSLPRLRKLIFHDNQDATEIFTPYLKFSTALISLHFQNTLDPFLWRTVTQLNLPDRALPQVFKDALPSLADLPAATRPIFGALLRPTALTFRAGDGFFVGGCSTVSPPTRRFDGPINGSENTSKRDYSPYDIHWQVGSDASNAYQVCGGRAGLHRALATAMKELSVQAIWQTNTVTNLELHLAPCEEFIHLFELPDGIECLKEVVDAFPHLCKFAIGGEVVVRTYLAGMRSGMKGWRGLEELSLCLHRPSGKCYQDLVELLLTLGDPTEAPGRLVVRLPQHTMNWHVAQPGLYVDFRGLKRMFPGLDVSVIGQECATCHSSRTDTPDERIDNFRVLLPTHISWGRADTD